MATRKMLKPGDLENARSLESSTSDAPAQDETLVRDFIASIDDEKTKEDCLVLVEMMQRISSHGPKMWNVGTIGFDTYHV